MRPRVLAQELAFYKSYDWGLNPFLPVASACEQLRREIERLGDAPADWRGTEIATNVFLLSCAIANAVEEHLRGPTLRLPRKLAGMRVGRAARTATEAVLAVPRRVGHPRLTRWLEDWQAALDVFLAPTLELKPPPTASLADDARGLLPLLDAPLPAKLLATAIGIPSPFRRPGSDASRCRCARPQSRG